MAGGTINLTNNKFCYDNSNHVSYHIEKLILSPT